MTLMFKFISGKYKGGEFPLDKNMIIVGRHSELDMVLSEDMVSRKHARILVSGSNIILEDMGSTNGTFVNGSRIKKVKLKLHDRILIGSSIAKLVGNSDTGQNMEDAARVQGATNAVSGSIEDIPIPEVLQLLVTSKKTGVLKINMGNISAEVYLVQGIFKDVKMLNSSVEPKKILFKLIKLESGHFEFEQKDPSGFDNRLNITLDAFLLEAAKYEDEVGLDDIELEDLDDELDLDDFDDEGSMDMFDLDDLEEEEVKKPKKPEIKDEFDFDDLDDEGSADMFDLDDLEDEKPKKVEAKNEFDFDDLDDEGSADMFDLDDLEDEEIKKPKKPEVKDEFDFDDLDDEGSVDMFDLDDLEDEKPKKEVKEELKTESEFDFDDLDDEGSVDMFDLDDLDDEPKKELKEEAKPKNDFDFDDLDDEPSDDMFSLDDLEDEEPKKAEVKEDDFNLGDLDDDSSDDDMFSLDDLEDEEPKKAEVKEDDFNLDDLSDSDDDMFDLDDLDDEPKDDPLSIKEEVKEEIKEEAVVDLAGLKEKFPSEAMYSLPLPLFSPLDELTKEQLKVLQLVHNFGSISDIIENTELSLEKTYSSLDFLLEEDYIEQ